MNCLELFGFWKVHFLTNAPDRENRAGTLVEKMTSGAIMFRNDVVAYWEL